MATPGSTACSIAAIFKWPGAIHEGNGEAIAFVDERADEAQREALLRIMTGQDTDPFATMFAVYASTVDEDARAGVHRRSISRSTSTAAAAGCRSPTMSRWSASRSATRSPARNRARRSCCPTASNMRSPTSAARRARPSGPVQVDLERQLRPVRPPPPQQPRRRPQPDDRRRPPPSGSRAAAARSRSPALVAADAACLGLSPGRARAWRAMAGRWTAWRRRRLAADRR